PFWSNSKLRVCWAQVLTKTCPLELVATPMPSPIYTLGGSFMKSFTTSYLISGASMALGSSFNWAGVRWPGGVGADGAWANSVVAAADSASPAAAKLMRHVFIRHLNGGARCSSVRV